jgi:predicted transcriptional regulator
MAMPKPKEVLMEALQALPDDATYEDIEYHLFVRARIEEGRRAVREGRVIPNEEVKPRLAEWRKRAP